MSSRDLDRRTTDAARTVGGGRHRAEISRVGCPVVIRRSRPEEQAFRTSTWPGRRHASLVSTSHPSSSKAETVSSTVTRISGREASVSVNWPSTPSANTPDRNRCRQVSSISSPPVRTAGIRNSVGIGARERRSEFFGIGDARCVLWHKVLELRADDFVFALGRSGIQLLQPAGEVVGNAGRPRCPDG